MRTIVRLKKKKTIEKTIKQNIHVIPSNTIKVTLDPEK